MKYPLYLASGSAGRKSLLASSLIPFSPISQNAEESQCSLLQPLETLVTELAELKMNHVIFPSAKEGDIAFFLTADTMTMDINHKLHGKPVDRHDAVSMLKTFRTGATIGTAFCLDRKIYTNEAGWITQKRIIDYDQAWCVVDIPDAFIDFYLSNVPFMDVSGAVTIEGFGEQFVKEIRGSYSAILGLPMYKVRESLFALGFYSAML